MIRNLTGLTVESIKHESFTVAISLKKDELENSKIGTFRKIGIYFSKIQ